MDKVNEAIEVSEQETPFHLLPQEEQQHIIDANRKRVREAQTLHVHIPADHEHQFRFNVNTISGPM